MSLLISKSTAKNFADVDSEIDSKIILLPIHKSTAKNCVAADSEISNDGGVISALLLFFLVFADKDCPNHITKDQIIKGTRL